MIKRYKFLYKEFEKINKDDNDTINLYIFYKPKIIPIPIGILYRNDNTVDASERNLLTQREYFHKILNLPDKKPLIKKNQLKMKFIKYFRNQCCLESKNLFNSDFNLAKNIQLAKIGSKEGAFIDGDYYYYHTALRGYQEKVDNIY